MMDSSREALKPDEHGLGDAPAKSQGRLALALGVIAIALSLVLGFVHLISVRRLEREVARLSQQTEGFSRLVVRAQEQSQTLAQQASQAASNAQAAAQQRDLAKQEQSNAEAQAQLTQLQEALGQIAETRRTALGLVMTLDSKSIRFDFDKATIKPEYRDILNRIAGIMMTLKGYTIAVYGYTDDVGTQSYNLQLSQRRAQAVRDFLVQTGISATIMSTKGFGKADPRVPGDSEQARAANRRVEIGIVDSKLITNGPLVVPK
jgi:outer membrane protein OmpA-like peptidoglycan-associated protein